ncbi:MAG TPA: lmo0937 family membrane protein [Terriglobia bacterium]|nr:lmo0937 family membrane protein [Terriglobia bacterium]
MARAIFNPLGGQEILWTIAIILVIAWFLGLVTFRARGAYVHILRVLAIIVVLIRIIPGR